MYSKKLTLSSFFLTFLFATACSLTPTASPTDLPVDTPAQASIPTVAETATVEAIPTGTPNPEVIISTTTGSLAIRRGPGTAYNLLGYLKDGEFAIASARDTTGDWLYIPIPSFPSQYGWVSAGTQYSTLQGDINSLEIMNVGAAQPITIRNCTYHPMLITPANILLAPQNETPNNKTVIVPGEYAAYDQSVTNTQVKTMSLAEGDWVDITTDGLSNTYACP
jgi:hypothetical protein